MTAESTMDEERVLRSITHTSIRQRDCSDLVYGQVNIASYALLAALRGEGLVKEGVDDLLCFARSGDLLAFNTDHLSDYHRMLDVFRVAKMVGESFNVRPAIVRALVSGYRPEVIGAARMRKILSGESFISGGGICFISPENTPIEQRPVFA